MLWLCHLPCPKVSYWQQAILALLVLVFMFSERCGANSIGIEEHHTLVDFGEVSPQFAPYVFPLASQLVVSSPEWPWFLEVKSDTHFQNSAGESRISASSLEWRRHSPEASGGWIPFGPARQIVAESPIPTDQDGEMIGMDYRLNVTWDMAPTEGTVTLDVQYTVGPTADLLASYVTPNPYNPNEDGVLEFGFYLPWHGAYLVTIKVINAQGEVVYVKQTECEGEQWHTVVWSGVTLQGFPIDPGQYSYQVTTGGRVIGAGTLLVDMLASGFGQIRGVVRDAETLLPLHLATVKVYNSRYRLCHTMKTNKKGEFQAAWLAPDRYLVQVSCPGYFPEESAWFTLGPGQTENQELFLLHNNSLVVEDFQLPERWPVGQPVELFFRIANPGTAEVLSAAAWLEVPGWVAVCSNKVWIKRSSDAAFQAAPDLLQTYGQKWRLELGGLDPGESVSVRILCYAGLVAETTDEIIRLWAEGITAEDTVTSAPVEKYVQTELGIFQSMRPSNRVLVNRSWETDSGDWQSGIYLNYPSEVPLKPLERHHLQLKHGLAATASPDLLEIALGPMVLKDGGAETVEGSGWIQYKDRYLIGLGERTLPQSPVGSDHPSAAGLHGLASLTTGSFWAAIGRPEAIRRREEWEISRTIREVTLTYEPLSTESILVYQENASGERRVIEPSQYSVSLSQKRIVFFHPISPQTAFGQTLVVEYDSAWDLGEAKFLALGAEADLGWHQVMACYFQVPECVQTSPSSNGQFSRKENRSLSAKDQWITLGVEGELPDRAVQYKAVLSTVAGREEAVASEKPSEGRERTGGKRAESGLGKLRDQSAVELDVSWFPSPTVTLQMENTLAGGYYRSVEPNRSERFPSSSELSLNWLLSPDVTLQTELGTAWGDGDKPRERSVSGGVIWSPQGLPAFQTDLTQKASGSSETRTLSSGLAGEAGALDWRLWAEVGRVESEEAISATKGVGIDLDYQLGSWSSAGLSYSRSEAIPKESSNNSETRAGSGKQGDTKAENALELRFQTTPFEPISLYVSSGLEWDGSFSKGFEKYRKSSSENDGRRKTFDVGMTGDFGNGVSWDTSIMRRSPANGTEKTASGVELSVTWEDPSGSGLRGQVVSSRAWGRLLAEESLLERLFSLPVNLGTSDYQRRSEWAAQVEYNDSAYGPGPQIEVYAASGRYQDEDGPAAVSIAGAKLILPWTERTDFLMELDCQIASRDDVSILTRELSGGVLYRLNERWSARSELSRFLQNPSGEELTSLSIGLGYEVTPRVTISGGLSYLWNGKTNYGDDGLQPYLQFYCGAVPFDLVD